MDHKDLADEVIDQARAQEITDGVHRVLSRIASAESTAGRAVGSIQLLAITKTRDVGEILAAIDAGIRMIGKNCPQEIAVKAGGLAERLGGRGYSLGVIDATEANAANAAVAMHIPFHLTGRLQANKIGKVLPIVDTIESMDSIELAKKIVRRATMRGITVGVLLEVNESGGESKSGCAPSRAIDLAQYIGAMGGLRLQGLMTIDAHVGDERTIRADFAHLHRARDQILASGAEGTVDYAEPSMGMTHDMAYAIEEDSTIMHVDTVIFGRHAFI